MRRLSNVEGVEDRGDRGAGALVFGFVTMHLWNWLMPAIFGLKTITFLQALGLLVLGKILFGGFHRQRRRRPAGMEAAHGGALGADDAGGARALPRGNERAARMRLGASR